MLLLCISGDLRCDQHLWLPNRTRFLFEVDLCSAENCISQPLLKGGVVPRRGSSPWDVSGSPGWGFPTGSLLGVRLSWCTLLASHISLSLSFFFWPESQSDAEGGATVLGPHSDEEEDG